MCSMTSAPKAWLCPMCIYLMLLCAMFRATSQGAGTALLSRGLYSYSLAWPASRSLWQGPGLASLGAPSSLSSCRFAPWRGMSRCKCLPKQPQMQGPKPPEATRTLPDLDNTDREAPWACCWFFVCLGSYNAAGVYANAVVPRWRWADGGAWVRLPGARPWRAVSQAASGWLPVPWPGT